ncbi:fatty acid-binding protein DegV [Fictibacillus phosphorivorans]|uniref:Fatty acid-binding protein DegV n=1 Tax=Fictibacillus phosphorivorans TaxID=1221500 RepID=A0A163PW76_9BACL|nr:DegV family protein [Fictibacillus phosphorivorans]KZE64231.1 fatty acid-binding protein DegV [Fictibacillus phosphorivorans]
MSKVAVITDSTSYIPEHIRNEKNIVMIPLNVVFDNETYKEEAEIKADDFYDMVSKEETLPKTSQPAIGELVELLEELSRNYDEAVMITLSSGISGTYQSAVAAGEIVEGIKLHVFDSEISCSPQAFYVLKAAELASEGSNGYDIMNHLLQMKNNGIPAYFVVDDLNHLHRGGRLNTAQLFVGNLLQIKPILHFEDKKIIPFEKVRTKKKALKRIFDIMDENVQPNQKVKISVIHAKREDEAVEIAEELREKFVNADVWVSYFGPVIGTHLGEGSLGITWVKE